MGVCRNTSKSLSKFQKDLYAEKRSTESVHIKGCGPEIATLKAQGASCLSCTHQRSKPFGFMRCELKSKVIAAYNICDKWEGKKK